MKIITKYGAYLRGLLHVAGAIAVPLAAKSQAHLPITRADIVSAVLSGIAAGAAFGNQLNAETDKDKRVKVWIVGVCYVVGTIATSILKPWMLGRAITWGDVMMALIEGGNALYAYMSKALTLADVTHPIVFLTTNPAAREGSDVIDSRTAKPPLGDQVRTVLAGGLQTAAGALLAKEAVQSATAPNNPVGDTNNAS